MRLTYLILFADLALRFSGRHGVLHWSIGSDSLQQSVGILCLAVTAFGLIASIGIPAMARIVRSFAVGITSAIPWQWTAAFRQEPNWSRPTGCATPFELRDLALEEKNDFLLRLNDKYDRARTQVREQREQAGTLVFGVLLLMVMDGMGMVGGSTEESIVDALMNAFHPFGSAFVWAMAIAGFMALKWAWWESYQREWTYCPPLCRTLHTAEEKERREVKEIRRGRVR